MIQVRGNGFYDLRVDARGNKFSRDADRVADGKSGGDAVTDDDVPVDPEERSPSGFFVVGRFLDGRKRGF